MVEAMLVDLCCAPRPRRRRCRSWCGANALELAHEAVVMRPGLPVILSSGYTGEALGAAADAPWPLLRKPYTADALAAVIETVMGKTPECV